MSARCRLAPVAYGIGKQRVIALASLTVTETGQLTEAAHEGPAGLCRYASDPGQVVSLDAFYAGRLKGTAPCDS